MPKRASVDPAVWKTVEERAPEEMTNEELLDIFEHLAIKFAQNPRLRGAGVFKQRFRSVLLERMKHTAQEHSPGSSR